MPNNAFDVVVFCRFWTVANSCSSTVNGSQYLGRSRAFAARTRFGKLTYLASSLVNEQLAYYGKHNFH